MFKPVGETKVGDDHVPMFVQQQILEFQITVNDIFLVKVVYTGDELGE